MSTLSPEPERQPKRVPPRPAPSRRAIPRRVGAVTCTVCGKPALRHSAPPNPRPMCGDCTEVNVWAGATMFVALALTTPALMAVALPLVTVGFLAVSPFLLARLVTDPQRPTTPSKGR